MVFGPVLIEILYSCEIQTCGWPWYPWITGRSYSIDPSFWRKLPHGVTSQQRLRSCTFFFFFFLVALDIRHPDYPDIHVLLISSYAFTFQPSHVNLRRPRFLTFSIVLIFSIAYLRTPGYKRHAILLITCKPHPSHAFLSLSSCFLLARTLYISYWTDIILIIVGGCN